jgi:PAS domain S-box-containing protein
MKDKDKAKERLAKEADSLRRKIADLQAAESERQSALEALNVEKERLAVTLCSIADGVITTDTEGRIVLMNNAAEELTGWKRREAEGKLLTEVFQVIDSKTRLPCENPVEKVLRTGRAVELPGRTILIARNGTERLIADSAAPIYGKNSRPTGVVVVFQDVTVKRKLEDERLRASKLESVGILAGGIAHDFNNMLTVILGNISLVKTMVNPSDKLFERLTAAENACFQAQGITLQLLTFAKGGKPVKKPASLSHLIREATVTALRGTNVRSEFSLPDDLWAVELDEGLMRQAVNHLVVNAVQAMPGNGVVAIRGENVTVGTEWEEQHPPLQAGKYVRIAVRDLGSGIPQEHLPRIFDPYFTTKQQGNGMGLAISYSIIKNHNGYITVESELGVGTTVSFYLPASPKPIRPEKASEERPPTARGRILVMDDEETIRDLLVQMLTHLGYEAEAVRDGAEAIERYRHAQEAGRPFVAVILDLNIPGGMGGRDAVQKLREIDPRAKAIVSSGYYEDPVMADFRTYGFSGFIPKPYSLATLQEVLQRVALGRNA